MKLTKQGVRDLNAIQSPKRETISFPFNCAHLHMRYVSCEACKIRNVKCKVKCFKCGFEWQRFEGTLG